MIAGSEDRLIAGIEHAPALIQQPGNGAGALPLPAAAAERAVVEGHERIGVQPREGGAELIQANLRMLRKIGVAGIEVEEIDGRLVPRR